MTGVPPFTFSSDGINSLRESSSFYEDGQWQDKLGTRLTISCLQCDWSVETTNTSTELSVAFLGEAQAHSGRHEQHAIEIVQRLRLYSANYVEPTPPHQDTRTAAARRDSGIQAGFLDKA